MTAHTQQKTQMYTQRSNVGASFAGNPEDSQLPIIVELQQLALVNRPDTQLSLDGRDEWWSLEQRTGQRLERTRKLRLTTRKLVMKSQNTHVFLSSTLLTLYKSRRAVNADNETSRDLGIESSRVTSPFDAENALEPGDDFVRGGVRRLIEVDDTG